MVKFKADDILMILDHPFDEHLELQVVTVKAHDYTLKPYNYKATQKTWDLDHEYVHNNFRKLTKLDKALK